MKQMSLLYRITVDGKKDEKKEELMSPTWLVHQINLLYVDGSKGESHSSIVIPGSKSL